MQKYHNFNSGLAAKNELYLATWLCLTLGLTLNSTQASYAAGILGNGTPASCTEAAFDQALIGGGTVTFNCGATSISPVTIRVKEKVITASTVIDGANQVILDGGGVNRLFSTKNQAQLTVKNLTMANGSTTGEGGAILSGWRGKLTVYNCKFTNNKANQIGEAGGGAIFSASEGAVVIDRSNFTGNQGSLGGAIRNLLSNLTVTNSTFDNNRAFGSSGGAIYIDGANGDYGKIIITNTKFTNNKAVTKGGALFNFIYNRNATTIDKNTFSSNSSDSGAGIWTDGGTLTGLTGFIGGGNNTTVSITNTTLNNNIAINQGGGLWHGKHLLTNVINTTIASNTAKTADGKSGLGGGIMRAGGNMTLNNVTIANNNAGFMGAGIFGGDASTVSLKNTIIANNQAGNIWGIKVNCSEAMADSGNNMQFPAKKSTDSTDKNCTNSIKIANPLLAILANNGGTTQTINLLTGSPAVNAGNNTTCATTDQRGVARPQGGICDIGAVEAR